MKPIYFDYAASTPIDSKVMAAMSPYFTKIFANPNSLHRFGQEASRAVFVSRQTIAHSIGADYREIIFTGSATEANNIALRGSVKGIMNQELRIKKPRIITTAIEHESVLETCRDLEKDGVEVIYIPVSKDGLMDLKKFKTALNDQTILVSIIYANNEIGAIQPIREIANIIRNFKNSKHEARNPKQIQNSKSKTVSNFDIRISDFEAAYPLLHTDAVQAFQYLDCNVNPPPGGLGVDLMTLSAHKIYGPKGIGALYVRNSKHEARNPKQVQSSKFKNVSNFDTRISDLQLVKPIMTGGDQENGLRSGTENVPYIVGFAKAVELADEARKSESARMEKLRNYFWQLLQKTLGSKSVALNGSLRNRLPNNLNIYFSGRKAQELLIKFDLVGGVAVSPGAACATRVNKASYVLEALGFTPARASGSLRFSFGRPTTNKEIDSAIASIKKCLKNR